MKQFFVIAFILISAASLWGAHAPITSAQSTTGSASTAASPTFTPLAPIPGLTDTTAGSVVNSATLANFLNNLYKYLIGLAAALAVIEIIWGGIEISTQDSVSKKSDGKSRIYQAIMGLVLILSPYLVFTIINPSILNLSLNLPPLNTVSATNTPSASAVNTSSTCTPGNAVTSGCVAQLQTACTNSGGSPVTTAVGITGNYTVTCNPAPPQAGTLITQAQCVNLPSFVTILDGSTCSTESQNVSSFQQAGGYTCNNMTGGVCLHK